MKQKQIIILSLIFAILVLGIALKSWVRSTDHVVESVQGKGVAIAQFDPAKVERVLIGRGLKTPPVELAKENGIWKIKSLWNAQADPAKVEKLIQEIGSAHGELRGEGKSLFPDFGLQDADSFSVKFLGAGNISLADLRFGTKQAGADGCFVRPVSSEKIYLVDLSVGEVLGIYADFGGIPSNDYWADLGLFKVDPELVTKITAYNIKGDEKTMVLGLEREVDPKDPAKSSWNFLRKDIILSLDPEKVTRFIAILANIKAQKVVEPDGKEAPSWQLAVTESGKKTVLSAWPKDVKEGLWYVKVLSNPSIFSLNITDFADLNVDDTHFVRDIPVVGKNKKVP